MAETAPWTATILTLFPEMFPGPLGHSLSGKALEKDLWRMTAVDIRDFATDKHRTVDDTPFGGGAGMVMRADVIDSAIRAQEPANGTMGRLIYLSPRGRVLDQELAEELAQEPALTLLCGRYEGVDQRVLDAHDIEEVSIGDYVLSGGEVAAMVLIDACVRLIPGVMGNDETVEEESFTGGLLEYPHYTRPAEWTDPDGIERVVPEELKSGNHALIRQWRHDRACEITKKRRPDLWASYENRRKAEKS